MLTFVSFPKPFTDRIARLQRNAVRSWRALDPHVDILLLGDEPGVGEMAGEVRAERVPDVAQTQWGAPRVDDIFRKAEENARNDLLCYINADIILLKGFLEAVGKMADVDRPFLVIGRRWDLDAEADIDFRDPRWEDGIRELARVHGRMHSPAGIDYFIFRKGLWPHIPPFGLGRTVWDNWLVMEARRRNAVVVDATGDIFAIHQAHDYSHHPEGIPGVWFGPEAIHNEDLAGRPEYNFTVEDATHVLGRRGIRRDLRPGKWKRRISTQMVLRPSLMPVLKGIRGVYRFFCRLPGRLWRGKP